MNLFDYSGKVKIIDKKGYVWVGVVYGWTPRLDTEHESCDEIDIEIIESTKDEFFKSKVVSFKELEIKSIEKTI